VTLALARVAASCCEWLASCWQGVGSSLLVLSALSAVSSRAAISTHCYLPVVSLGCPFCLWRSFVVEATWSGLKILAGPQLDTNFPTFLFSIFHSPFSIFHSHSSVFRSRTETQSENKESKQAQTGGQLAASVLAGRPQTQGAVSRAFSFQLRALGRPLLCALPMGRQRTGNAH